MFEYFTSINMIYKYIKYNSQRKCLFERTCLNQCDLHRERISKLLSLSVREKLKNTNRRTNQTVEPSLVSTARSNFTPGYIGEDSLFEEAL